MTKYYDYQVFKDVCSMNKEFRACIKSMPTEARHDIGDEIRRLMRELKYNLYLSIIHKPFDKPLSVIDSLNRLKILIDECLEDGFLLMKGPNTIFMPRKRLMEILDRLEADEYILEKSPIPLED